jgi:aryl-alcohol dehydrogenase-like predicted oxidoreductase
MNYRKFGNTDLTVSEIGFGAWAIGGDAKVGNVPIGWGPADDDVSILAIHAALDAGINFFDTADFYGLGHSEMLLGKILKNNKKALIATKVGHRNINEQIVLDYSEKYIMQSCENSLKRLQREIIDYYQLHSARVSHLENGECISAMENLKEQGKIRYWGLSLNTFNPALEAEYLMERRLGDGFQLVFNIINQRALPVVRNAGSKGYGIIARMPLQFGLLTGKFNIKSKFRDTDHRHSRLTPDILKQSLQLLESKVWPLSETVQMDKTSFALSFILSLKEISTVITGIRTADHVLQNTNGIKKLDDELINFLFSLSDTDMKTLMEAIEKVG